MKKIFLALALLVLSLPALRAVEVAAMFTDNMVLQQQTTAALWGKALPGHNIQVQPSWNEQTYEAITGENGVWKVNLNTPAADNIPYTIRISDTSANADEILLQNVLLGEVWICSGQSNMEMPVGGWGCVNNYEQEIAAANYPEIRLFQVAQACSASPLDDLKNQNKGWEVCSPATILGFSATAYFFGRNLYQNLNVPVGLIAATWGGTAAESWCSAESLKQMSDFDSAIQEIDRRADWEIRVLAADPGYENGIPVWAGLDFDDASWQEETLPGSLQDNLDGVVWFRKTVNIPEEWAGKTIELQAEAIDDTDISFFNSQAIGETDGWNTPRNYRIAAKLVKAGPALIALRVTDMGGSGGIYGEPNTLKLVCPDNNQEILLSGTWKYKVGVNFRSNNLTPIGIDGYKATVLFNAMIHPFVDYAIQGAIWYQGENNADRAEQYRTLFPLLINDWRSYWQRNFPFYYVQLANFMNRQNRPQESGWAELREAQRQTLALDNTAMAVAIDLGVAGDIHPKNKQDVGLRLALIARAQTYGEEVVYSGPMYRSYALEDDKIRIRFDHSEGLKRKNSSSVQGFALAGTDGVFQWATAQIEGEEVVVNIDPKKIDKPVHIRYAWADNPSCNLYNGADLPASPFQAEISTTPISLPASGNAIRLWQTVDGLAIESPWQVESLAVYSAQGKRIESAQTVAGLHWLSYPQGVYLVLAQTGNRQFTSKLVKQ